MSLHSDSTDCTYRMLNLAGPDVPTRGGGIVLSPKASTNRWREMLEAAREFGFSNESILRNVPRGPGVYEILQFPEYARYEGATRILKVGESDADLQAELANHMVRHTAANRLARIRNRAGVTTTFRYVSLDASEARDAERSLLKDFEDHHWDLPLLNSQRGYLRGEDKHFR